MQITRESMFSACYELGEEIVKNKILHWNTKKAAYAREWLEELEAKRSTDALSRQEDRELKSIEIAREANRIASLARDDARSAKIAAWIAAIAATISIAMMIISMIIKPPN